MTKKFFVDTNILIYTLDKKSLEKSKRAVEWLDELAKRNALVINLQVINEICHVALRKMDDLSLEHVQDVASAFMEWGKQPVTEETFEVSWSIRRHYGYSWFDSLLLASAHQLECSFFLSEDLQDGQDVMGLTIINPFKHSASQVLIQV